MQPWISCLFGGWGGVGWVGGGRLMGVGVCTHACLGVEFGVNRVCVRACAPQPPPPPLSPTHLLLAPHGRSNEVGVARNQQDCGRGAGAAVERMGCLGGLDGVGVVDQGGWWQRFAAKASRHCTNHGSQRPPTAPPRNKTSHPPYLVHREVHHHLCQRVVRVVRLFRAPRGVHHQAVQDLWIRLD